MSEVNKGGTVYILTSVSKRVVYTGVTSDLMKRIWQHKDKYYPGSFTSRYGCCILVYYRHFESIIEAIEEEKRIKGGSRLAKEQLIESINYDWKDLSTEFDW
jgi:putative endonuclease